MKALPIGVLIVALTSGVAHAGTSVEVWTRAPGNHSATKKVRKQDARSIELEGHKATVDKRLQDLQYGKKVLYRGVPLARLLADTKGHDLAVLHFGNGAVIPVSTDARVLKRLDALVAVAWKEGDGAWQSAFPDMHREAGATDPRPLTFAGNKLVVPTEWHPYLKDAKGDGFSPWRWVNHLTGIELTDGDAYFRQFVPKTGGAVEKRGLTTYLRNCQYCHSAHDVGADYGGDFLRPFALHTVKSPKDLTDHVTIRKMNARRLGLMMPTQKQIDPDDLGALLKWVEALSKERDLSSYAPPGASQKPAPAKR